MLIGISGKIGVGKTTCADLAVFEFGATKTAFAKVLKLEAHQALVRMKVNFTAANLYGTFEDKAKTFTILSYNVPLDYIQYGFGIFCSATGDYVLTFRDFLQWYGTQYRRAQNETYWIEKFFAEYDDDILTVVDDVRFQTEAEAIKSCGGFMIRVERLGHEYTNNHQAEIELDNYNGFNLIIRNDRDLTSYLALCKSAIQFAITAQS